MADYVGVLADLKARRAAIDEERAELDGLIQGVERLVARFGGVPPVGRSGPRVASASRSMSGLTMPEAVKAYFQTLQGAQPQTTRQVLDGLRAGGVKGGKNLRGHVYNTLHRLSDDDGPFVHFSDGRWGLRESRAVGEAEANRNDLPHQAR